MSSRYYKILVPLVVFIAAAGLVLAIGYRDLHPQQAVAPVATSTALASSSLEKIPSVLPITQPTKSVSAPVEAATNTKPVSATTSSITLVVGENHYMVGITTGETIEDAMTALATQSSFTFTQQNYQGLGEYVDSINGKSSGNGYYWFLYVNGKVSETGISTTHLSPGDTVEWRYDRSY